MASALRAAGENHLEQLCELDDSLTHLESDEAERGPVVEQHDENDAARDIREVHRLLFALVKERVEIVFADQFRELVVRAEVGGGQRRERRRVEVGPLADGGDELAGAIDEQRTASVAIGEESLQRLRDRAENRLR